VGCLLLVALVTTSCRQADVRTALITVPEMKNQACANRIITALANEQGIHPSRVTVRLEDRRVEVAYDSLRHSLKNLEFTIADAGFSANDVPVNLKAQAALPPECR
jgi:copper chaperone CopZ